jgi:hypothetical protein
VSDHEANSQPKLTVAGLVLYVTDVSVSAHVLGFFTSYIVVIMSVNRIILRNNADVDQASIKFMLEC